MRALFGNGQVGTNRNLRNVICPFSVPSLALPGKVAIITEGGTGMGRCMARIVSGNPGCLELAGANGHEPEPLGLLQSQLLDASAAGDRRSGRLP